MRKVSFGIHDAKWRSVTIYQSLGCEPPHTLSLRPNRLRLEPYSVDLSQRRSLGFCSFNTFSRGFLYRLISKNQYTYLGIFALGLAYEVGYRYLHYCPSVSY